MSLPSLEIRSVGEGKPLVLLHGFPLSSHFWDDFTPPMGFRLLLPDFPGFGASPLTPAKIDFKALSLALEARLRALGAGDRIHLGGLSMGGYWAFEFARLFPKSLEKLILISTRAGLDRPEARQNRLRMAERVETEGMGGFVEGMLPGLLSQTTLQTKPQVVGKLRQWILEAPPGGVALAQRVMADRRDQRDLLPALDVKTLILAGQEDALIPPSESEAMARLIPGSELQIIAKVGHLLPIEDTSSFQALLNNF
ncbi:MAG TPA: alpha/beta hydrolase [bacterium]|nr:alpha/beta hydrolase [bacterium]